MALNTNLPPWMQDRSFWASDPNAGSGFKFGMQLGMQNAQQQAQLKQRAKAIAFEQAATALKQQAQEDMIKGQLELSAVMADGARNNLYTDPKWEANFWETVSRHPRLMSDSESFGRLTTTIENAKKAKQQIEVIRLRDELSKSQDNAGDIQVIDAMGEPYVEGGENKPAFIRSTKTGALHKLPQDWSEQNPVVPLEIDGKVIGYGLRNASGGITQLREQKSDEPVLSPAQRGTMNAEFGVVKQWWDDLDIKERRKPEMQAEMKRRLKEVENRFSTTKRVRVKSPSGKVGSIPESQLQDALKQGYTPVE